ncbi:hypothetical protein JM946_29300 [Steroidobacter sp. S1-65]|uniref:Uncharacterized protein n=1 Tax=Steroidobacter gossypii TaxID=2805490 RepID=A0ABS1X6K5_9GAMM|nr:hypothetical protein [Steroidobacter gossypii]MBM0108848.1 hypothetical protein [Steroidobacter gossypii]
MISSDKLQAGERYYFVSYEDRDASVPVVETLRFKNKTQGSDLRAPSFVFERLGHGEQRQCQLSENLLNKVFEFETLVAEFAARAGARRVGTPYEPRYCDD